MFLVNFFASNLTTIFKQPQDADDGRFWQLGYVAQGVNGDKSLTSATPQTLPPSFLVIGKQKQGQEHRHHIWLTPVLPVEDVAVNLDKAVILVLFRHRSKVLQG